ncbi:MAG TPA: TetR family transcriptional regulator [Gaiellaceae bacterium]|jgi:AcrR family transcriptional regulator
MARPVDPHRRAHTLGRAADYVLENGLEGLSLRPLAAALGTSTRMLLYDFESKEQLVDEILAEIRRRLAGRLAELQGEGDDAATLVEIWSWVSAEERAPFMRVFFETHVRALSDPKAHRPMIDDWLRFLESRWEPEPLDPATATLFVAVIRGLLLDRLTATDPDRVDAALGRFTELLESEHR